MTMIENGVSNYEVSFHIEPRGALLTSSHQAAAEWIKRENYLIAPFGKMLALFCDSSAMDKMAVFKGREDRPFVTTSHPNFADCLLETVGISDTFPPELKRRVFNLLSNGSEESPIGLLLPAQTDKIHPRLLGNKIISIDGEAQMTVGVMVSAKNEEDYRCVVEHIPGHTMVGTSANYSGDKQANGSGHHAYLGVMQDFGIHSEICVFISQKPKMRKGPSTTQVYISENGDAHFVRIGSIERAEMTLLLQSNGFQVAGDIDGGARAIAPYDYSEIHSNQTTREAKFIRFDTSARTAIARLNLSTKPLSAI